MVMEEEKGEGKGGKLHQGGRAVEVGPGMVVKLRAGWLAETAPHACVPAGAADGGVSVRLAGGVRDPQPAQHVGGGGGGGARSYYYYSLPQSRHHRPLTSLANIGCCTCPCLPVCRALMCLLPVMLILGGAACTAEERLRRACLKRRNHAAPPPPPPPPDAAGGSSGSSTSTPASLPIAAAGLQHHHHQHQHHDDDAPLAPWIQVRPLPVCRSAAMDRDTACLCLPACLPD